MATARKRTDKAGKTYYIIAYRESREAPERSMKWTPPEGWSQSRIERQLDREKMEFEQRCKAGDVLTKKEIKAAEEEAERLRAEEERLKAEYKPLTLRRYAEESFMPDKIRNVSAGTVSHYRNILRLYIYPKLGDCILAEITHKQIKELLAEMQQTHSHGTVIHVFSTLTGIFKMAMLDDDIDRNPMDKVVRPKERKEDKKDGPESYTAEELDYILQCLEDEPLRWRAYTYLMANTGMRRGEVCGLKWSDIDFDRCLIKVERSLNYTQLDRTYLDKTKTGQVRIVDVDPDVLQILLAFRREIRNPSQPNRLSIVSDFVFPRSDSADPMSPQEPNRWMRRFSQRHGIEHLHPHKLRHTMASIAVEQNADIASIAKRLGHANISTTMDTYVHSNIEAVKRTGTTFWNAVKEERRKREERQA